MKNNLLYLSILSALTISTAHAETTDFGGYAERFKGGGDKIPPRCTIDMPKASTEPFFIKWYCVDDNATSDQIRTELWLYKNGAQAGELVANFLGFPASVKIDEGLLGATNFADGLPASFKLLAKDMAGNTTISAVSTASTQDNSLATCDLEIVKAATESTGSSTGTPELRVSFSRAQVNVSQLTNQRVNISTAAKTFAETCEIDSVCFDSSFVTFASSLEISQEQASGTVSIIPGSLVVNLTGSASFDNLDLTTLEANGTTKIEGVDATVSIKCQD